MGLYDFGGQIVRSLEFAYKSDLKVAAISLLSANTNT